MQKRLSVFKGKKGSLIHGKHGTFKSTADQAITLYKLAFPYILIQFNLIPCRGH